MSGRKSNLKQYKVISAGVMTGTNVLTSSVTAIEFLDNLSYQFDWTSSPVGTFQIQISNTYNQDNNGNVITTGTWVPITMTYYSSGAWTTATTLPTSVGTPIYVDVTQTSAPWIRAVYTNASGTGVLNVTISGKML